MTPITVTKTIAAPIEVVFQTVADIAQFSKANPQITKVEFLTESHRGVGTRFRETRLMKGKEATTELEVTEYLENDRIRMIADSHGAVWDTVFTVREVDDQVTLKMVMESRPYKLMPRIMNPLIRGAIAKAVEGDMDAVKVYCESPSR